MCVCMCIYVYVYVCAEHCALPIVWLANFDPLHISDFKTLQNVNIYTA